MKPSTAYAVALIGLVVLTTTAQAQTFTIAGTVTANGAGLADVTMLLSGAASDTTTTNENGEYIFDGLAAGTYTVTPMREGYAFAPESLTMTFPGTGTTTPVFDGSMVATSADAGPELPVAFALEQNFPNPFNAETVIRYQLAEARPVRLDVVDLLGRTVAVLIDDTRAAGTHTVTLDAETLPSGLYFYRLHTGSTVLARRMVLAR